MNFWTVFRNTLFVTVCTVIVASAVSFMSAYGISHLPQKTGDKLYTLFVVGQIIPFHAVMIAISMLSTKLGLTNTHLGLIIFYSGFYYIVWCYDICWFSEECAKRVGRGCCN